MEAGRATVAIMCPNWQSDKQQRDMYQKIQKEMQRAKNPTRDWMCEKAYAWLKWFADQPSHNTLWWYPLAIQVAYELFLGGSGKFESFMKYLKKRNHSQITKLIQRHESMTVGTLGLC